MHTLYTARVWQHRSKTWQKVQWSKFRIEEAYDGKAVILPWAMFFLTPGSSGASPELTGTSLPSEAVPVAFSACGAIIAVLIGLIVKKSTVRLECYSK